MKIAVVLCLMVLGLSSCEWGSMPKKEDHPIFKDTLTYTYKTIHERAADCGNKPDSACTVVKMKYPEFKGQPLLNDTIKSKLLNLFILEKPDTSLKDLSQNFLNAYADFKKSGRGARTEMFFELDIHAKVIRQDSALVSLEYGGYTFLGGAHGASFTGFVNWNPKANKEILLKDILVDGYNSQLTKVAEGIFRKNEKLTDTASLEPDYFFKDGKFALNENYAITPLGLRFMYNQYEIKPYAAGQTELFIPYTRIKTILRPNSVVTQFINKNAGI
jgi:hypothetical protein